MRTSLYAGQVPKVFTIEGFPLEITNLRNCREFTVLCLAGTSAIIPLQKVIAEFLIVEPFLKDTPENNKDTSVLRTVPNTLS